MFVAAEQIARIELDEYRDKIRVILKTGERQLVLPAYGKSVYETLTRLVSEVDDEMQRCHPTV
jgi:hypothetical protein